MTHRWCSTRSSCLGARHSFCRFCRRASCWMPSSDTTVPRRSRNVTLPRKSRHLASCESSNSYDWNRSRDCRLDSWGTSWLSASPLTCGHSLSARVCRLVSVLSWPIPKSVMASRAKCSSCREVMRARYCMPSSRTRVLPRCRYSRLGSDDRGSSPLSETRRQPARFSEVSAVLLWSACRPPLVRREQPLRDSADRPDSWLRGESPLLVT
mmetsp:Transcript_2423/g.6165  ORF Transcript_2423/g.6165 Transcript_2423/m.6165 type:complete len:210 (+) Transcript_2423:1653-2282(+)